jgi:hypothetical protein
LHYSAERLVLPSLEDNGRKVENGELIEVKFAAHSVAKSYRNLEYQKQ